MGVSSKGLNEFTPFWEGTYSYHGKAGRVSTRSLFKAIGGGSEGQFLMLSLYQRASSHEFTAFYGIEKARSVVEIRYF